MWNEDFNGKTITERIFFDRIIYSTEVSDEECERFTIRFTNKEETKAYDIVFDAHPLSYNVIEESYLLNGNNDFYNNKNDDFFKKYKAYYTLQSNYLEWFKEISIHLYDDWNLLHCQFNGTDYIVDVISKEIPKIIESNLLEKTSE